MSKTHKPKAPKKFESKGTGLHIDSNTFSLWKTETPTGKLIDLKKLRPFQSFVALSDAHTSKQVKDGGLEVVPGFHTYCEDYFKLSPEQGTRRNLERWGTYNTKLRDKDDKWILNCVQKIQRIPPNWKPTPVDTTPSKDLQTCINKARRIITDHDKLDFVPIQKGDFIFWDIRLPHQNSDNNDSDICRSVFYHAYLLANPSYLNSELIEEISQKRPSRDHISDFNKRWTHIEKRGLEDQIPLNTPFEKMLYNQQKWEPSVGDEIISRYEHLLTEQHIAYYEQYGYVVVENLFENDTCDRLYNQILSHSKYLGCDVESLLQGSKKFTADDWQKIGGTFGSMVEFFWLPEQEKIRLDERAYALTAKLLKKTWLAGKDNFHCPFASEIDYRTMWMYNDRVNIRVPDAIVRALNSK